MVFASSSSPSSVRHHQDSLPVLCPLSLYWCHLTVFMFLVYLLSALDGLGLSLSPVLTCPLFGELCAGAGGPEMVTTR